MPRIQQAADALVAAALAFAQDSGAVGGQSTQHLIAAASDLGEAILNGGVYGEGRNPTGAPDDALKLDVRLVVVPEGAVDDVRHALQERMNYVRERYRVAMDGGRNNVANSLGQRMFDLSNVIDQGLKPKEK